MNKLTFIRGALVALALSLGATALLSLSLWLFWPGLLTITCLVFGGYLLTLLWHSKRRAGRLLCAVAWLGVTLFTAAWFGLTPGFLAIQALSLWLLRSWLFHRTPSAIALDGFVGLLAIGAALWAFQHSGSIGLAIWSYFLIQASFCWIGNRSAAGDEAMVNSQRFDHANRQGEAALRRLMNKPSKPAGNDFSDLEFSSRNFGDYS